MASQKQIIPKLKNLHWQAPEHWLKIRAIDAHTEGEPLRIIIDGFPELKGDTILERRRYAREHYDHLRKSLMWEPRGHADMYGCIITEPVSPEADFGVLFTQLSYEEIGAAAMLSRTTAGIVLGRAVFCIPGSPKACNLALERIILPELPHLMGHIRPAK